MDGVGLIDTNILIDMLRVNPDDLPETPVISSITLAELSVGPLGLAVHPVRRLGE